MAKSCIGLDIGSSSVKAAHLVRQKAGHKLLGFGIEPLPAQAIVDGAIMDHGAVVDAVGALISRLHLKKRAVAIAIAGNSVIVKKISVPNMSAAELAEQIPYEAERHIPYARSDVELDYQVLGTHPMTGRLDLVLVAAKKEIVSDYAEVLREAKLVPTVIDVAGFAVQNAFEANYDLAPGETAVVINVGAAFSNLNIIRDGASLFVRDIAIGGRSLTEDLQKSLAVGFADAEALKLGIVFDDRGIAPEQVAQVIATTADVIAGELQRSIDFFLGQAGDTTVSKICLAGGTAKLMALARAFERRSRLPVEILDAWRRIDVDPRLDAGFLASHAPEASVALGLALRAPNDKPAPGVLR
ncbi:MAG TPA: type IV pilus assembly protein PilM [Kofleriaceae bacterium]|nr:type IV pilus assembly protein PilM [Kofleriaceae bacterium]